MATKHDIKGTMQASFELGKSDIVTLENNSGDFVVDVGGNNAFSVANGAAANALVVNAAGNVGIGIAAPEQLLHVDGGNIITRQEATFVNNIEEAYSDTANHGSRFTFRKARGTRALPTEVQAGDQLISLRAQGQYSTTQNEFSNGIVLEARANENWDGSNRGTYFTIDGVSDGEIAAAEWLRLANGNVGIGTSSPGNLLSVTEEASDAIETIATHSDTAGHQSILYLYRSHNTEAAPGAISDQDSIGTVTYVGHDGVATGVAARINSVAAETWSAGNHGTELRLGTVAIGSAAIVDRFTIENDGTLHSERTDYETLVTDDDDIPNKKYVDDLIGSSDTWDEVVHNGAAVTILDTENLTPTINQNDVTNDPDGLLIVNIGAGDCATLQQNSDDTDAPSLALLKSRATGTQAEDDDFLGEIKFDFYNDDPALITGARIHSQVVDVGSAAEKVNLYIDQMIDGANTTVMNFVQGNVGIGETSPDNPLHITGSGYLINLEGATGSGLKFFRNDATITDGEDIGVLQFTGADPSGENTGAFFRVEADGAWAASDYPTRFVWESDDAGSNTEWMRLTSEGRLLVGHTITYGDAKLYVRDVDTGGASGGNQYLLRTHNSFANRGVNIGIQGSVAAIQGTSSTDTNEELALNPGGGYVGIGTTSPSSGLDVVGASAVPATITTTRYSGDTGASRIFLRKSRGTEAAPAAVQSGDFLGVVRSSGYDGSAFANGADIEFEASELWSGSAHGAAITFYTVPNTTTTAAEQFRITHDGKLATRQETAPDVDRGGLCLKHGSDDGNVLTFKNSDIVHGMTDFAETDTYFTAAKVNADSGGVLLDGFTESVIGFGARAFTTTESTTTSTAATGAIQFNSSLKNGTGSQAFGATGNTAIFRNDGTTTHIFKGDGDIYTDTDQTSGLAGTFDEEDDLALCRAAGYSIAGYYDKALEQHQDRLQELGIMEGSFVSHTKMMGLQLGAFGQLWNILRMFAEKFDISEDELMAFAKQY